MTDKLISDLGAIGAAIADTTVFEAQRSGQVTTEKAAGTDLTTYVGSKNLSYLADPATARANLGITPLMDPDFSDASTYLTVPHPTGTVSAGNMLANTMYMIPIWVPRSRTYSTYALAVTTGTGTSTIRLGLYNCNSSMQPTTKIDEIGTPLDGTTNALKTGAFGANAALKPGWYFIAAVVNVTTPVLRMSTGSNVGPLGAFFTATTSAGNHGKTRSFTYAALPADETAQSYTVTGNGGSQIPMVGIR